MHKHKSDKDIKSEQSSWKCFPVEFLSSLMTMGYGCYLVVHCKWQRHGAMTWNTEVDWGMWRLLSGKNGHEWDGYGTGSTCSLRDKIIVLSI